jgi:phosphomannomutase
MLAAAVTAGLCSSGIDVIDLGLVTTPSVSVMTTELGCIGGVMITASHNPIPYNGIKLLLSNGIAPPASKAQQIRNSYLHKDFKLVVSNMCGSVQFNTQTYDTHIAKVLNIVDKSRIAAKKFRVVLDSVNGAGGPITKKLLAELGCETIAINDEPTGKFEHMPEPTAENLTALCDVVKAKQVDIGFAQDPDADRLAIVDEQGSYIGEEYTLALVAKYVLNKTPGSAVTNLSTSRMIDDIAKQSGSTVIRTPVGEANVAEAMVANSSVIGGEGNGGVIDLRVSPVRDSLVAIALTLQLMAQTGKKLSQLVGEIPSYCMKKDKFRADKHHVNRMFEAAKERFADAKLDTSDGCRFDFADGWLHLRTSNTEPIVRVIIEARDKQTVDKYTETINEIRRGVT